MNASSREKRDFLAKEERDRDQDRPTLVQSSSRRWSAFRNPRIVRVSRTFGGKDRHSKVCTVRGLRDRRIRLSVDTAVQLYDLQDKLGVGQPSKVIDWLIEATKHEIDELPPLQMPPGFGGFPLVSPELLGSSRSSLAPFFDLSSSTSPLLNKHGLIDPLLPSKNVLNIVGNWEREDAISRSKCWDANDLMRAKGKEVESGEFHLEKARLVEPTVPGRFSFLPPPNLSSNSLSLSNQQLGFMSPSDQNPFAGNIDCIASSLSLSSGVAHHSHPYMPHSFPPYNNATPHPLPVENSFQLFTSGQSSFMPPLHLFGSSNSRPVVGEYVRFLPAEYKTEHPPSL